MVVVYILPLVVCQGTKQYLEPASQPLVPANEDLTHSVTATKEKAHLKKNQFFTLHHSISSPFADEKATPE